MQTEEAYYWPTANAGSYPRSRCHRPLPTMQDKREDDKTDHNNLQKFWNVFLVSFHFNFHLFWLSLKHIGVSGRELAQGLLIIHRQVNCICWPDGHLRVASVTHFDA